MAQESRPFLFAKYSIIAHGKPLDLRHQFEALKELTGTSISYSRRAREMKIHDTVVFRPREFKAGHMTVISWSIGQANPIRQIAKLKGDNVEIAFVEDGSIRFTDFVACPSLGVLAVDDRTGNLHLGGKGACSRLKSMVRELDEHDAEIEWPVTPDEVNKALKRWKLTAYSFVVRPVNPHPPSRLSKMFSEAMKEEGIGEFRGSAKPAVGTYMKAAEGPIATTSEISDAGYGQVAFRGLAEGAIEAEIKRPTFYADPEKNEKAQSKSRELRIFVEMEGKSDDDILLEAAKALVEFYKREK